MKAETQDDNPHTLLCLPCIYDYHSGSDIPLSTRKFAFMWQQSRQSASAQWLSSVAEHNVRAEHLCSHGGVQASSTLFKASTVMFEELPCCRFPWSEHNSSTAKPTYLPRMLRASMTIKALGFMPGPSSSPYPYTLGMRMVWVSVAREEQNSGFLGSVVSVKEGLIGREDWDEGQRR